ncbi:MAG: histone deacetylase [Bryobacterales bacterium]|nr:histone deacetylase [Bryobacterales bacterium]
MRRRLYYCDQHSFPLPPGHRFPAAKYRLLREALSASGVFDLCEAPPAHPALIELAHDPAYVRAFMEGRLEAAVMRRIGFPWSPGLVARTLASVGGTLAAAADAFLFGFGGNLAGGTHHAFYSEGSGFCIFNDLAVAVHVLRCQGRAGRAAIVDLDVHQGDGTAAIFENDPAVLTTSMHGRNNFPFRKRSSRIDVALPDGTGDEEYLAALDELLSRVKEFAPEVVFYQSGVDGLATDRLGRLALTPAGLRERDRRVFQICRAGSIPLVITLGGGYSEPIALTVEAHAGTFLTAAEEFR